MGEAGEAGLIVIITILSILKFKFKISIKNLEIQNNLRK